MTTLRDFASRTSRSFATHSKQLRARASVSDQVQHRAERVELVFRIAAAVLVLVLITGPMYHLLRGSDRYLMQPMDDFYYYLIPAQNIVEHGLSSFDGSTVTNGYHPLWMMCMVVLVALFG